MQNYKKGWGKIALEKKYTTITQEQKFNLAVGNMRSYGDVCELAGGKLESMLSHNRFLSWDKNDQIVEVGAGMTIGELCKWSLAKNLFPSTVPGTQFPTIGGCIANDIHGKNHHQSGSFGNGVVSFTLRRAGKLIICSREENFELFFASIGGFGLTGVIESAKLQLVPMLSPFLSVIKHKFKSLDEYFELEQTYSKKSTYTVAWLDCAKTPTDNNSSTYRGVYMAGNPIEVEQKYLVKHHKEIKKNSLTFPFTPPFSLVNKYSLRAFNELYYQIPRKEYNAKITHYQSFFFPLDKLLMWNRLYGKKGFYQYQSTLPKNCAKEALSEMLKLVTISGMGSPLMVLKNLGDKPTGGLMSYAREGVTLALDFVNHGQRSLDLLEKLDQITLKSGGCVNPSKDARMTPATFKQCFPQYQELEKLREKDRCSDFWLRVNEGNLSN